MHPTEDLPTEGDGIEIQSFDEWVTWGLNDPIILNDSYFVALRGDEYIGLRELGKDPDSNVLQGGLLGVRRTERKRGIGLAYAREHGCPQLKTCTAVQNVPIQTLFNKLGYARDPEWLQCQKDIN